MYQQISGLAKLIGEMGADVVTGGGPGLMHAASSGHESGTQDGRNHTIGLNIRLPFEQKTNKHLDILVEHKKFSTRLDNFVKLSNLIVVAPGGIGTLLEFFFVWQLMQVGHSCEMPIILMGEMWKDFLKWMRKWPLEKKLMSKEDLKYVVCIKNIEDAMKIIKKSYKAFQEGGKTACVNWKKYR